MAINSSGAVSFGDINVELGLSRTAQISLGGAGPRGLAGVASGAIRTAADFYGKSNTGPVYLENLFLTASVGDTFNGTAFTSLTFNTDGTLNYYLYVLNSGLGRSTSISQGATTIASGGISLVGFVSGMWKLSGNASDYEIFIAKNGVYTNITNATNNAWTNMNAQISLTVNTSVNDAINQEFNVSIRSASTQAVLASALITMDALAAGSN